MYYISYKNRSLEFTVRFCRSSPILGITDSSPTKAPAQLNLAILPFLIFTPGTHSAFCYYYVNRGESKGCVSQTELKQQGNEWCETRWNVNDDNWSEFTDSSGHIADIKATGTFSPPALCCMANEEIAKYCYDGWEGGTWARDEVSLNINFCDWNTSAQ